MGQGKLFENMLCSIASAAKQHIASVGATVYYNGHSITTGAGIGFDAQPFSDVMISLNVGVVQGALATVLNSVLESDTDDPTAATALASASFSALAANANPVHQVGAIRTQDTKRYLFLKTEIQGAVPTVNFGALWIGGTPKEQPTAQALVFNV